MIPVSAPIANEIRRSLAERLRGDDAVRALYIRTHRELVEIWIVTDPLTDEAERRLYALNQLLYERFPDAYITMHVEHAGFYDVDPAEYVFIVPTGTERVPLR